MGEREALIDAMTELNEEQVLRGVQTMLDGGTSVNAIQMCLNIGVNNVGKRFERGEYFIADLSVLGILYRDALRVLLLSGVLNLAKYSMRRTIEHLNREGLRGNVLVLIGGLCAGEYQQKHLGADGWAYDPMETVSFCKKSGGDEV